MQTETLGTLASQRRNNFIQGTICQYKLQNNLFTHQTGPILPKRVLGTQGVLLLSSADNLKLTLYRLFSVLPFQRTTYNKLYNEAEGRFEYKYLIP